MRELVLLAPEDEEEADPKSPGDGPWMSIVEGPNDPNWQQLLDESRMPELDVRDGQLQPETTVRRTVADTAAIAEMLHRGQIDKAGAPYAGHLQRVAAAVEAAGGDAYAVQAAWLHDAVEDTQMTAEGLRQLGFAPEVISVVVLMTRNAAVPPADYYALIRKDQRALLVKRCDIADNMDPQRLALLDDQTRGRLVEKYRSALAALD